MAAGALIVTEAGGACLHTDGTEFNLMGRQIVAAASEELAREIVSKIQIYKVNPEFVDHCPMWDQKFSQKFKKIKIVILKKENS